MRCPRRGQRPGRAASAQLGARTAVSLKLHRARLVRSSERREKFAKEQGRLLAPLSGSFSAG